MEQNLESLESLKSNLIEQGYDVHKLPIVIQWNKRDLPNITPVKEMSKKLNQNSYPEFEAIATQGEGVFETLKMISKLVLLNIKGGLKN
jgi:signal recognition particle receptor subunit beta